MYYENAELEVKQKIIGSIFPEKMQYFGGEYRTNRLNEVFSLICSMDKGFENKRNEKVGKNTDLSSWAPPSGLEPETL